MLEINALKSALARNENLSNEKKNELGEKQNKKNNHKTI